MKEMERRKEKVATQYGKRKIRDESDMELR